MCDDTPVRLNPKQVLEKRLEALAWALFLIMIGCLWLMPEGILPGYAWLFGAGGIMLGLNLGRLIARVRICGFTTILGITSILAGCSKAMNFEFKLLPILLIIAGISIIYTGFIRRR